MYHDTLFQPRNLRSPVLIQNGEGTVAAAAATWIWGGTAAFDPVADTTKFKSGTQSVKLIVLASDAGGRRIDRRGVSWNLNSYVGFILRVFCASAVNRISGAFTINMSKDAAGTFTNYKTVTVDQIKHGWNSIAFAKSDFGADVGTIAWTDTITNFRFTVNKKSDDQIVYFDGFYGCGYRRPQIAVTFDDGWASVQIAYDACAALSIPFTAFIIPDLLGGALYLTESQVRGMNSDPLAAICTHGEDRWDTATDPLEAIKNAVAAVRPMSKGRNSLYAAWPNGAYGFENGTVDTMYSYARQAGLKGARMVSRNIYNSQLGDDEPYSTPSCLLDSTTNLAAAKALVDDCIETGSSLVFCGHKLGTTADSLTWVTSDFYNLIEYLHTKRKAGSIDLVTYPTLCDRLLTR